MQIDQSYSVVVLEDLSVTSSTSRTVPRTLFSLHTHNCILNPNQIVIFRIHICGGKV